MSEGASRGHHGATGVADTIDDSWIRALSAGGTVEVRSYPPGGSVDLPSVLPSGARLQMRIPGSARTFTAQIVYGTQTDGFGYQVMPRGSGPLCMATELEFVVEGPVDYAGGVLAYYQIVRPHQTYPGMTVWQVGAYDIVTFDHVSLADAIENLELCTFVLTSGGLLIRPREAGWRVRQETMTVEADGLHYRISEKALVPKMEGLPGDHGLFYRHDDAFLLFLSDTAYAEIQRVETPDPHDESSTLDHHEALSFDNLPGEDLERLMRELLLVWSNARESSVAGREVRIS